jgi:hypothetical protein
LVGVFGTSPAALYGAVLLACVENAAHATTDGPLTDVSNASAALVVVGAVGSGEVQPASSTELNSTHATRIARDDMTVDA